MGEWRKFLAAAAALSLVLFASSDGTTAAPPSTPPEMSPPLPPSTHYTSAPASTERSLAVSQPRNAAHLRGCFPKELAYQFALQCRDPPKTVPMATSGCCGVALSTIARPACFCQVWKEPAFGMSTVYNLSNLKTLVRGCGGAPLLMGLIDEPCGDSTHAMDEYGCKVPAKVAPTSASCKPYKVASFVGWPLVGLLTTAVAVIYLWFWRPARDDFSAIEFGANEGCLCKKLRCTKRTCRCNKRKAGCTSRCRCTDCANAYGIRRGEMELVDDGRGQ